MDKNSINECIELSFGGRITFPEVIMKLANVGVERYITDLVGSQVIFFGLPDITYTLFFNFERSMVATEFKAEDIQKAISNIKQRIIDYPLFLHCIMKAGCTHYEVFIPGRKVIYFGRDGSHHIEPF